MFNGSALGARKQRAARGDHATRDLGQAEAGVPGGDHEVARQHDLEPAAIGHALDGSDQRRVPGPANHAVRTAALGGFARAVRQVGARAEHSAGTGEHSRPQVRVVVEQVERRVQSGGHLRVDRVAFGRPIHPNKQHAPVALGQDGHALPLLMYPIVASAFTRKRPSVARRLRASAHRLLADHPLRSGRLGTDPASPGNDIGSSRKRSSVAPDDQLDGLAADQLAGLGPG